MDADEREEIEAKDYRQREAEEAETAKEVGVRAGGRGNAVEFPHYPDADEQNPRSHGCGTQEAVADLKAVLLKHFGICNEQNWATVVVTIDYPSNTLTVNQTLQLVPPIYDVSKMPKCVRCGNPTGPKFFTSEGEHPCDHCGHDLGVVAPVPLGPDSKDFP